MRLKLTQVCLSLRNPNNCSRFNVFHELSLPDVCIFARFLIPPGKPCTHVDSTTHLDFSRAKDVREIAAWENSWCAFAAAAAVWLLWSEIMLNDSYYSSIYTLSLRLPWSAVQFRSRSYCVYEFCTNKEKKSFLIISPHFIFHGPTVLGGKWDKTHKLKSSSSVVINSHFEQFLRVFLLTLCVCSWGEESELANMNKSSGLRDEN